MKTVLITGATAGIGEATAYKLAESGSFRLIVTGRREDRLTKLKETLNKDFHTECLTLCFDIRNKKEVDDAISNLNDDWKPIDVLINNAGLALGLNPINEGLNEDWETMIDTNVKGLLYISQAVVPGMVENKKGQIINIGSIAGREVYASGNIYCATKHAVDAITKGMRIDLLKHNIKVSSICPGPVNTEFSTVRFKGDKEKADNVYEGYTPLYAEDIAECILFAVTRPAHVNINDMLIMATAQANTCYINRNN